MYIKKSKAFTLSELLIALVIIGVIAIICISALGIINPSEKGWHSKSRKMGVNLEASLSQILVNDSSYDDFKRLKDEQGYFSIEDENIDTRMTKLIQKYLLDIQFDIDLNNKYFSENIKDYKGQLLGIKLKDVYSNFFIAQDGMILGTRFYRSCSATEENANPPDSKGRFAVNDICGSVFIDVNAYKKPNKLGSDQYIIPIYSRGVKYTNE